MGLTHTLAFSGAFAVAAAEVDGVTGGSFAVCIWRTSIVMRTLIFSPPGDPSSSGTRDGAACVAGAAFSGVFGTGTVRLFLLLPRPFAALRSAAFKNWP